MLELPLYPGLSKPVTDVMTWDEYAEALTSAWLMDPDTTIEEIKTWIRGRSGRVFGTVSDDEA